MITQMFSVYDSAVEAYMQPFFAVSKGSAMRSFMDACNDPQGPFIKHPGDFTLFHLGEFDDSSGNYTQTVPTRLLGAIEVIKRD